jgi:uncharacterized repeat protein (TIGR03803 family)
VTNLNAWKMAGVVFVLFATTTITSSAQTFASLESFHGSEGGFPAYAPLVQGHDGDFYGTTMGGEPHCLHFSGCGTVFKLTPGGKLTTIYSFCAQPNCADGAYPEAALVLASNGNFYGTTWGGGIAGPGGSGTVFKITPEGKLTTLYSFCAQFDCPDGNNPVAGLTQATDGNFYGTTNGGLRDFGTVFKITSDGTFTTLHAFDNIDGHNPYAGLVEGTDGNLYGTTIGTIFKITRTGTLTTLYKAGGYTEFTGALIQGTDGDFYGTAFSGGANGFGGVFKMTPSGDLTTLYSFCSEPDCTDGYDAAAGLVQATDGNFYGVTLAGGDPSCYLGFSGCGTIFEITPAGTLTTFHSFDKTDGTYPYAALYQATNGTLYGSTFQGGDVTCSQTTGCGTIFSLGMGLEPFVSFVRAAGTVGQAVGILGQGFTGTTAVSLNGTPATFAVKSGTFIEATVPAGATTGYVTVTTPSGTLTSNVPFHVIP